MNLCIDLNSLVEECFSAPGNSSRDNNRSGSQGKSDQSKPNKTRKNDIAAIYHAQGSQALKNEKNEGSNAFKTLELVTLEGQFKLKKVFCLRH